MTKLDLEPSGGGSCLQRRHGNRLKKLDATLRRIREFGKEFGKPLAGDYWHTGSLGRLTLAATLMASHALFQHKRS